MKKRQLIFAGLLLTVIFVICGCNFDFQNLIESNKEEDQFVKVEIVFTDGQNLVTYLKDLGIESDARVYVGGASTNNFYDSRGNVLGAFNYQRVLYIRILPEEKSSETS